MSDLLRRSLGEQIAIETVFAAGLWNAHADPNQLEVAILNLAVNARDAMPDGGKLTLETANVHVDEAYAATQAEVAPGSYVMLAVTDNGTGMTEGTIARAFDPFFTTKDIGQGTGLGLSQVYGFVKQSGGHVKIYSEVGEGTTVKVYLPRFHSDVPAEVVESRPPPVRGAKSEAILVVEDDAGVRAYTTEILRELGYTVLEAATGRAALEILATHPEVQLLFTDVGLPGGMNGRQLADVARGQRRDLKVLFTSGYARNAIVHDGRLDPGVELITKPFTQAALATRLRTILDARASPARVLVVEDEVMIQMLGKEYLEEAGFKVDLAGSATEALNTLRLVGGRVDAVIVDIGLPDRSGDVLLREIRTLYPSMPIVLATGYGNAVKPVEANSSFLQKPYTKAGLIAALRSVGVP